MTCHPYLIFEGLDGSGKDRHVEAICARFPDYRRAREPDPETSVGAHIYRILRGELPKPSEFEMLGLFLLGRSLAVSDHPGGVVSNRSFVSSMVYQRSEALSARAIFKAHEALIRRRPPSLILLLECSVEECLRRIGRRDAQELYETREALLWAQAGYDEAVLILREHGLPVLRISTEAPFADVQRELQETLERLHDPNHHPAGLHWPPGAQQQDPGTPL